MAFHAGVKRRNLIAIAAILLWPSLSWAEPTSHGALLPNGAREVGKDRYQSPSPYAETLKFYWKMYGDHYPRKSIADLPGVRGVHIVNIGHGAWEGLNVYELNGVTRIFVLSREAPKVGQKKASP
jgi:hypothetical protein